MLSNKFNFKIHSDFLRFSWRFFADKMCGSFTCSKNTLVGLNVIYIMVSFLMIGVAVHGDNA